MQSLEKYIRRLDNVNRGNEDVMIEKLNDGLDKGVDIDYAFYTPNNAGRFGRSPGTILHYAVANNYERLARHALSKGASVVATRSRTKAKPIGEPRSSVFEAAKYSTESIKELLKERSLQLYSSYGLTDFHLDCALKFKSVPSNVRRYVEANVALVNGAISTESPLWPGATPILIAAKFYNCSLIKRLLDFGADPLCRDLVDGSTPNHYVGYDMFDERLFAPDATDTFSSYKGESHFHIACAQSHGRSLDVVERYLRQGVSPDLPTRASSEFPYPPREGRVGLHIAVEIGNARLTRLLLEYGADVDAKDLRGESPLEYLIKFWDDTYSSNEYLCLYTLIEGGSSTHQISENQLIRCLREPAFSSSINQEFFRCVVRLRTLDERLVCKKLSDVYARVLKKYRYNRGWNEAEYVDRCSEELRNLPPRLGSRLHRLLDSATVGPDFKEKFGELEFDAYPTYGRFLKIKTKRKLIEFEEKKKKIAIAVPQVQRLLRSLCQLPHLCADMILWNLSRKELELFVTGFADDVQ